MASGRMVDTSALFVIGDTAEDAGNYPLALQSFERGAALGDIHCLCRLAYLHHNGLGVEVDKAMAMRLYRRAWRQGYGMAGMNIAILYRERQDWRAMFGWWKRVADTADGSAQFELAKCYLDGLGVRRDPQAALRQLAAAVDSSSITEAEREEAQALLDKLRPRAV